MTFFEVSDLHSYHGASHILFGISLKIEEGTLVCLLGRNGAGKSTTLQSIMGLVAPKKGSIIFKDQEIKTTPPHEKVRLGIGYVPEEREIFPSLTVQENLEMGTRVLQKKSKVRYQWEIKDIWEIFPSLKDLKNQKGGYLSGGEQQMLTIARTLMTCPDFLLLDEPCEGLAPVVVKSLGRMIVEICNSGCTILMAEQNIKFALTISEYGYVIDKGTIQHQGSVSELKENENIRKYLTVSAA